VYRDGGRSWVHLGSRIKQCENLTNRFLSANDLYFGEMVCGEFIPTINFKNPSITEFKKVENDNLLLINTISKVQECVFIINPFTGLNYENITPTKKIKAILHTLYHAGTASVFSDNINATSIIEFHERCKKIGVDLYISPLEQSSDNRYSSTSEMLNAEIKPIFNITNEMGYAKLLVAYSTNDYYLRDIILNKNIFFEEI